MIQFVNKEFITDNMPTEGVLVLDTDLQGAWETMDHERMKNAFPRIYKVYRATCLFDYKRAGTCMLLEEGGYKVALLFTRQNRKESREVMMANMEKAVADLLRRVPCDVYLYSPILSRKDKCFNEIRLVIERQIKKLQYNWYVYRKDCPLVTKEKTDVAG